MEYIALKIVGAVSVALHVYSLIVDSGQLVSWSSFVHVQRYQSHHRRIMLRRISSDNRCSVMFEVEKLQRERERERGGGWETVEECDQWSDWHMLPYAGSYPSLCQVVPYAHGIAYAVPH